MPNEQQVDLGVLNFMQWERFEDPFHGLTREEREARNDRVQDQILAMLENREAPMPVGNPVADWPKVRYAIYRDGMFVIEASTPVLTAMLRFCPSKADQGDCEIHYLPHGPVEKGRVIDVKAVPNEGADEHVAMLNRFAVRYVVYTRPTDRAGTQKVWLIGLNTFRSVDATDETGNATR